MPFGVETGEPARVTGIFHPAGSEFRVAKATSADISLFGIEYQGKSGSAPRSSPGPPDGVTASAEGLRSVYAAARTRLGLIAVLFVLAVLAWWFTVDRMRGMDAGPGTELGTLAWFLGIWLVMMAAMMFPSVSPTVALYSTMTKTRARGAAGVCVRVSADVDGGRSARVRHF